MTALVFDKIYMALEEIQKERQLLEGDLRRNVAAVELQKRIITNMESILKGLVGIRMDLKNVALIVSLNEYKSILNSISESETSLKSAQSILRKHKLVVAAVKVKLPQLDRREKLLRQKRPK
jgi:hypothetical protein